jgi:hypothetical protein
VPTVTFAVYFALRKSKKGEEKKKAREIGDEAANFETLIEVTRSASAVKRRRFSGNA